MRYQVVSKAAYRRIDIFYTGRPLKISDKKLIEILDLKNNTRNKGYE